MRPNKRMVHIVTPNTSIRVKLLAVALWRQGRVLKHGTLSAYQDCCCRTLAELSRWPSTWHQERKLDSLVRQHGHNLLGSWFKPFVANCVGKIQALTNPEQWRHDSTKENPADLLTRGLKCLSSH